MGKFFIPPPSPDSSRILLTGEDARHIGKSLRMQVGDRLTLCDGEGTDYICEITQLTKEEITVTIIERAPASGEPKLKVTLFQALPKQGKMETIIQKCTELGVSRIVPFSSRYCVVKPSEKTERWQKVALEAAKQCGRGQIPVVEPCLSFEGMAKRAGELPFTVFCYEEEKENSLRMALSDLTAGEVGLIIGSEGGFDPAEASALSALPTVHTVTLGSRILRTETAGMAVLSAIMYHTNELS